MKHLFKLRYLLRPYWKQSLMALVLLTTMVFLDLSIPRLVQRIIDQGIGAGNQTVVIQTGLIMLAISAVSVLIALGNNRLSVRVGEGVARDLRDALFVKIQTFAYTDLDRMKTGQLMVRLTGDTTAFQRLTQVTLRIGTRAPLLMIGSLILMFHTSRSLAMAVLPLLLVTSAIIVVFVIGVEPRFRALLQKLDRLNIVLQENLAGARLVKAFVRADFESRRFESANEAFTRDSIRVMRLLATMSPVLTMCINAGMVIVVWAGAHDAVRGDLSLGQVVAFTNYLLTTITPLTMMTMLSNVWAAGMVSARRVAEVLDTVPDVHDATGASPLPEPSRGGITFEDVSFHYGGNGDQPVLEGIRLSVEPGRSLAILGATGAGKSTLVNLVPRFYDPSAGRVLVDGKDIRTIAHDSLLRQVAVVPQETILFSGTVWDNIRYGAPDATDGQVIEAAKAAQAHEFILALPRAYDTRVEERGVNLSGGQKQRLAIARALITHPKILILDDSTSSVDVQTETLIQDAIEAGAAKHTSLVVAQRISTVLKADRILVIDRGRIVAEGTHRELIQSSRIYQEIYRSQLGDGAFAPGAVGEEVSP